MPYGTDLFTRPYGADGNDSNVADYRTYIAEAALTPGDYVMLTVAKKGKNVEAATAGNEKRCVGIYEGYGGTGAISTTYAAATATAEVPDTIPEPRAAVAGDVVRIKKSGWGIGRVLGSASLAAGEATKVASTAGVVERDVTNYLAGVCVDEAYATASIALKKVLVNH